MGCLNMRRLTGKSFVQFFRRSNPDDPDDPGKRFRCCAMVNQAVSFVVFRIVLPFALVAAVICRQNVLSLLYLLLLLGAPVVSLPSPKTMAGNTGRYLKLTVGISLIATVAQIIFQVVLLSLPPYGHFVTNCSDLEILLRHLGFQRYDHVDPLHAARLIGPDILMLVVSVLIFVPLSRSASPPPTLIVPPHGKGDLEPHDESDLPPDGASSDKKQLRRITLLSALGDVIALLLLAAAGIARPSLTNAVYFLAFLCVATWLACFKKLRRRFAVVRVGLLLFAGAHLLLLYVYQLPIVQELLPPGSLYARLFGLNAMILSDCADPRNITFAYLEWATYVNPGLILALYWVLVMETKLWMESPPLSEESKPSHGGGGASGALNFHSLAFTPTPGALTRASIAYSQPPLSRSSMQAGSARLRRTKSEKPPSRHRRVKSRPSAVMATAAATTSHRRTNSYEEKTESSPLLSAGMTAQNYSTVGPGGDRMEIDPNGSVIFSHESNVDTDIAPSEDARRMALGRLRQLVSPLTSIFLLITRQSYIATLIVMMAYSITYHSWLTFVLLLWSCLLWMMPNSRKACLRSSPYIIAYAQGLLIIQYIYGLSLTDEELPQKIEVVNLQQIGLVKYPDLPCLPLTVKILYTAMFWITLRQYMEERYHEKNRDIVEGVMMQPFNMALNTTQSGDAKFDMQRQISMQSSPFMKRLGDGVLKFLTTYWIWVVACMLMVISLEGEKVVIFRIMYMALFLFFILIFQLSYRLWRATMYFFWLTVIIYSMLVLILIYTYQFENFPLYWSQYLGISKKLQRDIGLEVYDTGQLFLKLVPPTFFVVITIIQLHYFHKDFLRMSDIDTDGRRDVESTAPEDSTMKQPAAEENAGDDPVSVFVVEDEHDESSVIAAVTEKEKEGGGGAEVDGETTEQPTVVRRERPSVKLSSEERPVLVSLPSTPTPDKAQYVDLDMADDDDKATSAANAGKSEPDSPSSLLDSLLTYIKDVLEHAGEFCDMAGEFIWRFLEIHMTKIVLFAALMLAVYDVCTIHVVFVFLVTAALPFRPIQLFVSHCCSVWSSVLLLSKMIYQIDYIEEVWTVNCTEVYNVNESLPVRYPFNDTVNNAHWMGYEKVANLSNYLKGYIGLIVVLSVQAVVRVRQNYHRSQVGGPEPKPGVVFQDITRSDADDGLIEAAKYLINYAFYKFGVEICFMTTTAVIGVRLDICAVIYSLWLAGLFLLKRETLARVWPFFVTFLAIMLPIQYCLCVGMPPGFCIDYPWSLDFMNGELREWLFLPDFTKSLAAYKLAVDFFQLMFACCQLFVFQIEASPAYEGYEGGTNREIIYIEKDEPEENTIPDFVTYTKSYLDLFKVVVFSLFYWVTLAIIFLAGTNRVSLFAMGYVIGCFLFLWNGQDFYLKPLKTIMRLWNMLLAYNIFVIFIKTLLQMVGCVYIYKMLNHFCWAIQLFGIACLKKFDKQYAAINKIGECSVPEDEAGLLWDGICLGFMLMQRRLFSSYYFHHLVVEMHAQARLASRGAELINQLLMKEVQEQDAAERELVEKIKKKMDRIRANQQKIRGKEFAEPQEHFQAASDYSSASTPMYSMGTPSSLQPSSHQPLPITAVGASTITAADPSEDPAPPLPLLPPPLPPHPIHHLHRHLHHDNRRRQTSFRDEPLTDDLPPPPSGPPSRRSTLRHRRHHHHHRSSSRRQRRHHRPPSPPSSPPPPHRAPLASSPTGGSSSNNHQPPLSPCSAVGSFSLDGYLEPSLSVVGSASAPLYHPTSNVGVATPSEESFLFSPPPYLAAMGGAGAGHHPSQQQQPHQLLHRPGTPYSAGGQHRRSLYLNLNHVSHHYAPNSPVNHHPPPFSLPNGRQRSSSVSPPPPPSSSHHHQHLASSQQPQYTPRSSLVGLAPSGSIRRAYARRSSNPASPAFSHHNSIRSGDYFMFEEYSDNDGLADLEYTDKKSDDKEDDPGGMTVSKLLSSAMKSDIKQAVSEAKQVKGGQSPDTGVSGRTSSGPTDASGRPPISRTVSAVSGASSLPVGMSVSRQASLRSQGYAEIDRPPAFRMLHPMDDGGRGYDDDGGHSSRSPPLPEMEGHLKVPGQGELAEDEDDEEDTHPVVQESWVTKLISWLRFTWAFVEGLMVSATNRLNAISKDYRYVARCLAKEKKLLKEKGLVNAQSLKSAEYVEVVPPSPQLRPLIKTLEEPLEIRVEKASEDQTNGSLECLDTPEQLEKEFEKEQPVAIRLVVALWYALVSRSEIVCYVMIVYNQIKSASMLSLPLPFMAFVWGSLSMPRPTKTFWITIITYTEAVVVIKYIFQFEFFPWNGDQSALNQPFWPPRIIGLEKKEQYAVFDLALLMIIFFHRFILKSLGLWKDDIESSQSGDSLEAIESKSTDDKSKKSSDDVVQSTDSAELDEVDLDDYPEESKSHALECVKHYIQPFQRFFHNLFHPSYRVTVDVYAYMFLCDFSTFLILVFGYSAFGTGGSDGGVASYFEDNKVPVPFLVMLIAQFGLIIIDRALFLRKFILGKVAFQIIMVFVVHLWMFFVLPAVTERDFNSTVPPQLWYFVKCIYLLLAAYQIRSGYPTRILGNFLTKKYNYLNLFLFRGFMGVPFLFELRAMMDWIWTDTSMSLSSWLKMEDIFCNIFILKCQRRAEAEYPTPRGEKRNPFNKYGVGGSLLFVIIFIIWFPLVLFALGNTVGVPNPPLDVTVDITFGGYQPIFTMSAQHNALKALNKKQYDDLLFSYRRERNAAAFLQNFDERDVVVAELSGNSTSVWGISPPSQQQLIDDLLSSNPITLKLSWHVSRSSANPEVLATQSAEVSSTLEPNNPIRRQFALMLNASAGGATDLPSIRVDNIFPKFVKVPGRAKSTPVISLAKRYSNLNMTLRTGYFLNSVQRQEWWEVREDCNPKVFPVAPFSRDCNFLRMVTINDKVFPTTLSILSGYGIVGMYTTLVLLASRFVRGLFAGVSFHIMFDDMPYVDRVLQLCLDIYLVRESGELHLEEDLFAKLIFLYRSPETLIKWTRFPQRPNSP